MFCRMLEAQKNIRRETKKTDRPWNLPWLQGPFKMERGNSLPDHLSRKLQWRCFQCQGTWDSNKT